MNFFFFSYHVSSGKNVNILLRISWILLFSLLMKSSWMPLTNGIWLDFNIRSKKVSPKHVVTLLFFLLTVRSFCFDFLNFVINLLEVYLIVIHFFKDFNKLYFKKIIILLILPLVVHTLHIKIANIKLVFVNFKRL